VRRFLVLGAIALSSISHAVAQPTPLIIDQARQDRVQQAPAPADVPRLAQPAPDDRLARIAPFTLTGVRIEGTSVAPAALGAATRDFIGKQVDGKAIAAIADAVAKVYAGASDIALYTVAAPEQDLAGGVLTLVVTEGYVADVTWHGDTAGDLSQVKAMAGKLTRERPLRRSTLQRYLSLIRDLPGLTLDAQLLRGETPGAVTLSLGLRQKSHAVSVNINNGGNALLGRTQMQVDLSLYNLSRQGAETKLSFGTSTLFDRYQYLALSHSESLNDEGTRASLGFGYLRTDVGVIGLTGEAQTLQVALSHPLIRSFEENLTVSASLDGINSTNALLGNLLANEDVRTLRLAGGYSLSDAVSAFTVNASMSFGLDVFGARASTGAATGFTKLVMQGQYNRLLTDEWVLRLKALGQLAGNRLPISELYALGGPDFGRAFLSAAAQGDGALAGGSEISFVPSDLPAPLAGLELFGFADEGIAWYRGRPLTRPLRQELASAGAGIRLPIAGKMRLELQAANAILADVPGLAAGNWRFLFGLSGNF